MHRIWPVALLLLSLWQCKPAPITPTPAPGSSVPTRDNNLALGNPSAATTNANNYLLDKGMYVLSYNAGRGGPNWVSWHLSKA